MKQTPRRDHLQFHFLFNGYLDTPHTRFLIETKTLSFCDLYNLLVQ